MLFVLWAHGVVTQHNHIWRTLQACQINTTTIFLVVCCDSFFSVFLVSWLGIMEAWDWLEHVGGTRSLAGIQQSWFDSERNSPLHTRVKGDVNLLLWGQSFLLMTEFEKTWPLVLAFFLFSQIDWSWTLLSYTYVLFPVASEMLLADKSSFFQLL